MQRAQDEDEMNEPTEHTGRRRHGFLYRLRTYFLAGILATAPIVFTVAVASWVITFVDSRIIPLIPAQWNPDTFLREYIGVGLPGLGVVVLMVVVTLIGWITAGYVGHLIVRIGENIVNRMPVVRGIYSAAKQILETVFAQRSQAFREAVLVEYPRRGAWTIAFFIGKTKGEVQSLTEDEMVNIYVPTTPNPTSGFLLFVPREDVVPLSMTVEEALKVVLSGGIVTPPDRRPAEKKRVPAIAGKRREGAAVASGSGRPPRVATLIED
jgi:uncharacterized membrane protein